MSAESLQIVQLVITGVLIPLGAWTLREVFSISTKTAASNVKHESIDREIVDLRARVVACETRLLELERKFK